MIKATNSPQSINCNDKKNVQRKSVNTINYNFESEFINKNKLSKRVSEWMNQFIYQMS